MNWFRRLFKRRPPREDTRSISTPLVEGKVSHREKSVGIKVRPLGDEDLKVIHRLEKELLRAGVLGERLEPFTLQDRIEDILEAVAEEGLANVAELVGDEDLNKLLGDGTGGDNPMLDGFEEYDDYAYNGEGKEFMEDRDNGLIALRLPDGSTLYGQIPGKE